jgi:hypothetical protein
MTKSCPNAKGIGHGAEGKAGKAKSIGQGAEGKTWQAQRAERMELGASRG